MAIRKQYFFNPWESRSHAAMLPKRKIHCQYPGSDAAWTESSPSVPRDWRLTQLVKITILFASIHLYLTFLFKTLQYSKNWIIILWFTLYRYSAIFDRRKEKIWKQWNNFYSPGIPNNKSYWTQRILTHSLNCHSKRTRSF